MRRNIIMALNHVCITSMVVFMQLPLLFAFPLTGLLGNAEKNISITVSKDVTLLCSLSKGVPEGFVSESTSLQMTLLPYTGAQEEVVASVFSYGEKKLGDTFRGHALNATVKGNIKEGWIEVTIPNLREDTLGIYTCVVVKLDSNMEYVKYKRTLTIGQDSSGMVHSQPGFQATVRSYCTVYCMADSGCFCNKSFPVDLLVINKDQKLHRPNCTDVPSWQCESNLKTPTTKKENNCYLLTNCGAKSVQLNCTRHHSSLLNQKFDCDEASPPDQQSEASPPDQQSEASPPDQQSEASPPDQQSDHELTKTPKETKVTEDNSTSPKEEECQQHLFWIVPFSFLTGALCMCVIFFACFPWKNQTGSQPKSTENEDKVQEEPAGSHSETIDDQSRALMADTDPNETADGNVAAAAVKLRTCEKDVPKRTFKAEEEEEEGITDIAIN